MNNILYNSQTIVTIILIGCDEKLDKKSILRVYYIISKILKIRKFVSRNRSKDGKKEDR